MIGPTNIGGRIVDIALDPQRRDALYVAAASGELWRSTDAGLTYAPAWPGDQTQAMGAVATAPDGTVYAGTGETNPGGGSLTYMGTGMYKSTDGGRSWAHIGLRDSGAIGRIIVDPRDQRRLFVAASGSLFNPGGDRGVYRSDDAGATWRLVLDVPNSTTGATEVMFDPSDPQRMFAVLWDHRRQPQQRTYSGLGSGVYRSDDGGNTWRRLDSLAPPAPDLGRIGLGIAPSDPDRLYAIVGRGLLSNNFFGGFYTSANGGDTWSRLPDNAALASSQSSYAWWFAQVWVNPDNAAHAARRLTPPPNRTWGASVPPVELKLPKCELAEHLRQLAPEVRPERVALARPEQRHRGDVRRPIDAHRHEPLRHAHSPSATPQRNVGVIRSATRNE